MVRKPFILRPDRIPGQHKPWIQVLRDVLHKSDAWFEALQAKGREFGIRFDFQGEVGNSLDSLRLVQWSRKHGLQEDLSEELARGHFEERKCTCNHTVLLEACAKVLHAFHSVLPVSADPSGLSAMNGGGAPCGRGTDDAAERQLFARG